MTVFYEQFWTENQQQQLGHLMTVFYMHSNRHETQRKHKARVLPKFTFGVP